MQLALYQHLAKIVTNKEIAWLITVVRTTGSTPGKVGMKMLVKENGELQGTIGGGAIEKIIIDKILTERFTQGTFLSFDLGAESFFIQTGMQCGGQQEVFIEPLFTKNKLYIIGAGHCGQELASLMAPSDFQVTLIDNRQEWLTPEKHPFTTHLIQTDFNNIANYIEFTADTYIVIMTYSSILDGTILHTLLPHEYKYLGVIGSKKKTQNMLQKIVKDECLLPKLKQVFVPVGLAIGAQTPREIAISIAAQLLAVKNDINTIELNSNPWATKANHA